MRLALIFFCFPFAVLSQAIETVIQKGHELAVVTVAISPDSNYVATGSRDKSAKLWEVSNGREVRSFLGHEATVTSLAFSSDGKLLITGSNDKTIRIWDVATGREKHVISTDDIVTDVDIDPAQKYFIVAGYGNSGYGDSLAVYNFATAKLITKLPASPDKGLGSGVDIAISNDGRLLAIGEDNRTVNICSTADWKPVTTLKPDEGWCGGCGTRSVFSPDNKFLFVASHNSPLKKYALTTFKPVHTYEQNIEDLTGLAISHDGKWLARATEKEVVIWDQASGDSVATIKAKDQGEFHEIVFSKNSRVLLISSNDNTAFAWNFVKNKNEVVLTGYLNQRNRGGLNYDPNFYWHSAIAKYVRLKNDLLVSPDGKSLIKGKFGTVVKQWDIASGKTEFEFKGHKKAVLCYDLSRDGNLLITGGGDGKLILWDIKTGDSLQVIHSYREAIFDVKFSNDGKRAVSCSWDATMKIHDLVTGKMLTYFQLDNASAYELAFHPNGLYVITSRLDNTLQMWEPDTKKEVRNFIGHTDVVSSVRLSSDHSELLTSAWDGSVRLWSVNTGLMIQRFSDHKGPVHCAIFSADEKFIYSAGADRTIRKWDVTTGTVVTTFEGHKAEVTSLLLSPDAKMLISHSLDGVTKFWDLSSGKEFFEHIHLGENEWMVKNPDGYFTATENARSYIHFVSGMKTYSADQFFDEFYRPDLLPKIFKTRSTGDSKTLQGKLKNSPPPTVKIAVLPTVKGKAEVYIRIVDTGNGVESLKLFHNGKNIPVDRQNLVLPKSRGQSTTYKHEIDLVSGNNVFSAIARNSDNIESDMQSAELFSDHVAKTSTCYLVAVGINEYKNAKLNLNFARADAASFGDLVSGRSGQLFKNVEVHTLYDKDATRQKILEKLDELSHKVSQEDVLIFFYAGHGSMVDNKFYFIPTESSRLYDASSLHREAIDASLLQEKFREIKALKQLIIMDACQSGASVELLATRGAREEKAIAQLARSAGIHVMASAGSEQFATEFASLGHGLFTHVLIRGLQGEADGAPKDGKVTIYELKSFVDDQVPEVTRKLKGNAQYPYTFSRGNDFPLVIQEETQ